jgi:hypothetical protein
MMAIEAVYALRGVSTSLELVDDHRRFVAVTLGAFPRGFNQGWGRLMGVRRRSARVHQERGNDERRGNQHGNEDALEVHDGAGLSRSPRLRAKKKRMTIGGSLAKANVGASVRAGRARSVDRELRHLLQDLAENLLGALFVDARDQLLEASVICGQRAGDSEVTRRIDLDARGDLPKLVDGFHGSTPHAYR